MSLKKFNMLAKILFIFFSLIGNKQQKNHLFLLGTGSLPPLQKGLHLSILHIVSPSPRIKPHSEKASIAYCEQVGVKRQHGRFSGEMSFR